RRQVLDRRADSRLVSGARAEGAPQRSIDGLLSLVTVRGPLSLGERPARRRPIARRHAGAADMRVPDDLLPDIDMDVVLFARIGTDAAVPFAAQIGEPLAILPRRRVEIDGATGRVEARMVRAGDARARTMGRDHGDGPKAALDRGERVLERVRQAGATRGRP